MSQLLLVDDEPAMLYALQEFAKARGHAPVTARSGAEALEKLEGVDAVVSDYSMPGMDGLEFLQAVRERDDELPVIILTAQGSERVAVRAMKGGAYEYVKKPFDFDELSLIVERALEARSLRVANRHFAAEKAIGRSIIGDSPPMRRLLDMVRRIAPRDLTVLVRGETGTGKELLGSLIHAQSRRASGPLVRFNCAAIPESLAASELFGHARGAFTGATGQQRGFFAKANGGTLILDEVGELPMTIQGSLLRALQEGEIQPVGTSTVERVDVRVVACTNRDLAAQVREGRFREDLYYRLAVVELVVPPLRERREDIAALAAELACRYAARFGMQNVSLSSELLESLKRADWPGNVRQLENTVARLVALSSGGETIGVRSLELAPSPASAEEPELVPAPDGPLTLREHLEAMEKNLISDALEATSGNQAEAARRLGVSRGTLIDRLKKYGLTRER